MKKIILALAMMASSLAYAQDQRMEPKSPAPVIYKKVGDSTYKYYLAKQKKKSSKPAVVTKTEVNEKARIENKRDTVSFSYSTNSGHVIVNGTVNGNITVNIITNPTDTLPKISILTDSSQTAPTKPIILTVVKTRAYQAFLDSRKDEKIRPNQYVYRDYESTSSFRRLRKRLKKALYPLEKGASASEFLLTEAGQNLLLKEKGVHNIINVRNAGIIDIYKRGDTLIADFHTERYSGTDSTGKMRIFYRK